MCGIAGFINFHGHERAYAKEAAGRMAGTLIHRGPDSGGLFVDDFVALAHRRLSIIDLAGGAQPMSSAERAIHIVFNGEIYNFLDIRRELESRGHKFATRSDTEVILAAYVEWGRHCVEHLNGMFAFAIWDAGLKELFLARDRVGKKPLYYVGGGGRFAFASELKALIAGGMCPREINPESMDCYLSFGYVPAPWTIFKGAKKLRAAHSLRITERGVEERKYWGLRFGEVEEKILDQAADEVEAILDEAVRCRLMSEVPLGAFLSGGIDSSLVVSSMARIMDRPVLTNSVGFGDSGFNELPVARATALQLRTDHREFVVEPEIGEVLEKIAWHFDEPFADSSAVPTWYVCRMAKENVTVALSGDGGDEGFGGYTFRYIPHAAEALLRSRIPAWLRGPVFGAIGRFYPASIRMPKPLRLKTIFENLAVSGEEAFYQDLVWLRKDVRRRLYSADFLSALRGFTPFEAVRPFYVGSDAGDPLGRSQHTDIQFYMTDDVLVKVDRMSMAHSLEVRCPLLDHRVLEFAAGLPQALKMDRRHGKILLRQIASRRLRKDILMQPKRGFSIPAASWLRKELRPIAEEAISGSGIIGDHLNTHVLRTLWGEHQNGSRDHSVLLWGVLMLHLWAKNYLGGSVVPGRPSH